MTSWKIYKLSEVAIISTGFPFAGEKYAKEGIRVVRGDNVTIGALRWDNDKLKCWNEPFARANEFSLMNGDIVVGMDGSRVGLNRAQVKETDLPLLLAQRVACIRHNEKTTQDFLYYQIFSERFVKYIKQVQTGTSIPHVSLKQIGGFEISLPSLEEQRRIVGILGAIDDKIENNRRINTNLELQAQALYKQWFVDFEFPNEEGKPYKSSGGKMVDSELGLIPDGWSVGDIGGYCKIRSGYAFKSSWWADRGVKIIKIKNITENGELDMSECSFVDIKYCDKASDFNGRTGDLIIAMTGATLGKVCIIPYHSTDYYINQRVGKFFLGENPIDKLPFIHCILKDENVMSEIINKGQGSAQPNISASDVETIKIVMPSSFIMERFNLLLQQSYTLRLKNIAAINSLATLRDSLLPKLMNGEIKIAE